MTDRVGAPRARLSKLCRSMSYVDDPGVQALPLALSVCEMTNTIQEYQKPAPFDSGSNLLYLA